MAAPAPAERGIGRGREITRRRFLRKVVLPVGAIMATGGAILPILPKDIFLPILPKGILAQPPVAQPPGLPPDEATPTPGLPPEIKGGVLPPTRKQVEKLIKDGRLVDFSHPDFTKLKEALPPSYSLEHLLELEPRLQKADDCGNNQIALLVSCHMRRLYGIDFWDPTKPENYPNPGFIDQLVQLPTNDIVAIETMDTHGICMNNLHPNYWEMDLVNGDPTAEQFLQASLWKTQGPIIIYIRGFWEPPVNLDEVLPNLKAYLASGFPFVLGVDLYERGFSPNLYNNTVYPPRPGERIGGPHAFTVFGYDDNWSGTDPDDSSIVYQGAFDIRNSWGIYWSDSSGNAKLPYDYLANLRVNEGWVMADDFVPPELATTCPTPQTPFRPRLCCDLADVGGDSVVRVDDIMQIANHWGQTPDHPLWDPRLDLDNDEVVSVLDIQYVANQWRQSCS